MDYSGLRWKSAADRKRISAGLKELRAGLSKVPAKGAGAFLLATWNIREFGGTKGGGRTDDAIYYIAECISHFDLVAVQEVRRDLAALRRVMRLLGPNWDVIYTDVSYVESGNHERLAFIYDRNQVFFRGLAGEIVLPKDEESVITQIARTPFICGFQSGWAKFNLCTVHIYYGTGDNNDIRVNEIARTASILAKKAADYIEVEKKLTYSPENLVLLGDFNIAKKTHKTYSALVDNGFTIPDQLQSLPGSNVKKDKFYDQIAFYKKGAELTCKKADVFDFYEYVFKDESVHADQMKKAKAVNFSDWRTYQMSDHLIMWAQFDVDKAESYFDDLLAAEAQADE